MGKPELKQTYKVLEVGNWLGTERIKSFLIVASLFGATASYGQLGVGFHQSNLPFVGVHYQLGKRLIPELRVGTDNYFSSTTLEGVLLFLLMKTEEVEVYGGVGGRVNGFSGAVLPVGLNVYPLTNKNFGLHIEAAPMFGDGSILRGSWGIRYRFRKTP